MVKARVSADCHAHLVEAQRRAPTADPLVLAGVLMEVSYSMLQAGFLEIEDDEMVCRTIHGTFRLKVVADAE